MEESEGKIVVKWSGKEYEIVYTPDFTVLDLKNAIYVQTNVKPERQKLLNLKLKGKAPEESCLLSTLSLKPGFKLMMMGSLEEEIEKVNTEPHHIPEVVNDLEFEEEEVGIENQEVYLAKVEKRVKEYEIKVINPFRPEKKLLVLDIDYTLFDHRSAAETGRELMRPFLHDFLRLCYANYDIVIWSATGMKWIEEKMKLLGVSTNTLYKIAFYLDSSAMISVHLPRSGVVEVKPLGVIWGKYPQYSPKNTLMIDDIRRNFIMNPKNGLKIRPFRQAHLNRGKDNELMKIAMYLRDLAQHCDDFSKVNHKHWERYKPKRR